MSMFGPEGGLVRQYSPAALAASRAAPPAAAPVKTTLRRIPLLPMQPTAPQQGYTLALTPQQQGLPHHRHLDVSTLVTGQLSLCDSQGSASWVATVVSDNIIGRSVVPRLTDSVVSQPVAVLVSPMATSSPTSSSPSSTLVASVTPIHFICRCNSSSSANGEAENAVTRSLQKYYVKQDTAALKDIEKNLADDSFEEEDPVLFYKTKVARKAANDAAEEETTLLRRSPAETVAAPPSKSSSFLKMIPALGQKREREESSNNDAGRSPVLTSAAAEKLAMPPPPPVAKVPDDLEPKTGVILRMHINKTMKFDELWKEVARSLDSFKALRNMSKDVQTEWARVCKASIQRILQQQGCHVADGAVTIPSQLH
ncbi:Hypothetical protein, putative [Bodo saltans]|uniref:Uncharacterized protein n=1 Tax=Bodo saltans TaxID=75058 RepID=A0A0S4IMN4_BODSA|nr:Hypothetical protein, putative [Bodo saltans]|eukprot:CUF50599.1 Hypothetical protein, putative [Bodo saltans]